MSTGEEHASETGARARLRDNPFYVLALPANATRNEIERQGTKLLGMLELQLKSAQTYATPVGPATRDADRVRRAMAELRDPERRLRHELWARLEPVAVTPLPGADDAPEPAPARAQADAPWAEAMSALGWRADR